MYHRYPLGIFNSHTPTVPHLCRWTGSSFGLDYGLSSVRHQTHDDRDVIKWKRFPRYRPFVRGIHRSPENSPHNGQWRGALKYSLMCAWTNGWVTNQGDGDWRRHRANYYVTVMITETNDVFSSIIVHGTDFNATKWSNPTNFIYKFASLTKVVKIMKNWEK